MMDQIQVKEYNLPDSYLYQNIIEKTLVKVWIPPEICIVLGRSNNPNESLFMENLLKDNIPVYKRPSGGETVILTPNTVVISAALKQSNFKGGKTYFNIINTKLKLLLQKLGVKNVSLNGISDLAINEVKILGSALYQNKDVVFYHAVLNMSESTELIEKYIKHPLRQPDYRKNRSHSAFVTSLKKENYMVDLNLLIMTIEKGLKQIKF